jgi:hypothetical protein
MWTSKERPKSYGVDEERSWEWHCMSDSCESFSVVILAHTNWVDAPSQSSVDLIDRAERAGMVVDDAIRADPRLCAVFAEAYLYAGDVTDATLLAAQARIHLGDVVRKNWDLITTTRNVSEFARVIGVERTSLYQVQDGRLWA